jgi:hypothetical protein
MITILPEYQMSAEQRDEILAMLDAALAEAVDVELDENSHQGFPALID